MTNGRVKDDLRRNFEGSFLSGTKDGIGKNVGHSLEEKSNGAFLKNSQSGWLLNTHNFHHFVVSLPPIKVGWSCGVVLLLHRSIQRRQICWHRRHWDPFILTVVTFYRLDPRSVVSSLLIDRPSLL